MVQNINPRHPIYLVCCPIHLQMREINPNIYTAISNIQNEGPFQFSSCFNDSGLFINQTLSKKVFTTWSFGWPVIESWKSFSTEDIQKQIAAALSAECLHYFKFPETYQLGVNGLLSQPQFLKAYILIKDTIPVGHAVNCAAHASLGMYLDFQKDPLVQKWVEGSFRKVSCKVTEEQFEKAKTYGDYKVISESNLGENVEVALAFIPRWEWPKFFNTLPLYK